MRTVLFTMSLAGTLALLCCVLVFRLFGRGLKAKWRRGLLILTLVFYVIPLPYCKFILLRAGQVLNIMPDAGAVSSGTALPAVSRYEVLIDQAGRYFYSDGQALHARGPMGLKELTTTKYIIYGDGQIR